MFYTDFHIPILFNLMSFLFAQDPTQDPLPFNSMSPKPPQLCETFLSFDVDNSE